VIERLIRRLIPGEEKSAREEASIPLSRARRPLEQLLHGLNQPLTGLQCSMEVALASMRTPEQYVQGLREGLELTERMRALVEAIREVVEAGQEQEEEKNVEEKKENQEKAQETIELQVLLREAADGLGPVAEEKGVRMTLESAAPHPYSYPLPVRAERRRLGTVAFRFLESALSLAARGSAVRIETGGEPAGAWIRVRWHAARPRTEFSRPELGLLVAQAGWERIGGEWVRERIESRETVTIRLASQSGQGDSK
jgi:signal transduction histidine kinase